MLGICRWALPSPAPRHVAVPGRPARIGGEFAALERLARLLPGPPPGELWLGDDAAVLERLGRARSCFTTDLSVAGVHADLAPHRPRRPGLAGAGRRGERHRRHGGPSPGRGAWPWPGPPTPTSSSSIGGWRRRPRPTDARWSGATCRGRTQLVVAVAVTGEIDEAPGAVLRGGARPGDHLFVTGPLGGAAGCGPARPAQRQRRVRRPRRTTPCARRTGAPRPDWPRATRPGGRGRAP